ncbi:hypothetical protein [Hymenobacter guriensis]|uniref:GIY-YIG nuclease family protein n=1 Tax=Hymenobacter guriensis TaxID=2793065 RepID=A0ABS0L7M7_9BACT|nr:hypothetical protein [Hymenobacter guriensis]MBG8556149.1 hypothetical protein [Hymenobacter guriensis]
MWLTQQNGRKAVLYVIRCYGNGESFYKVGITFCLSARFTPFKMPYKWRTIARYSSQSAGKVFDLEQKIHAAGLASYAPLLPFAGKSECYAEVEAILSLLPAKGLFILKQVNVDV